jgi:hypothetical protein
MPQITTTHYNKLDDLKFVLSEIQRHCEPSYIPGVNNPFIYGGYVRDILRGQPFQDMDIRVSSREVAMKFIQSLEQCHRMISLETRTFTETDFPDIDYQSFSLTIQTPTTAALKIDISYSAAVVLEEDSLNNCDFRANNLVMDITGNISTRVKAYQIGKGREYNDAEWTAACIRDCINRKLVWMIPNRFSTNLSPIARNSFMAKMNMRLDKMLKKGFVETGEYLTDFRLLKLRPVSSLPIECNATICAICHENYADTDTSCNQTTVSKCLHHFHTKCIYQWMNKMIEGGHPKQTCPCCRQEIELYY